MQSITEYLLKIHAIKIFLFCFGVEWFFIFLKKVILMNVFNILVVFTSPPLWWLLFSQYSFPSMRLLGYVFLCCHLIVCSDPHNFWHGGSVHCVANEAQDGE